MTQLELGNALSYSDKAVSKWERGEGLPDALVLLKISELFGCSVDYLLHEHSDDAPASLPRRKVNHAVISLIALVGLWTVAALAFVVMHLSGFTYPLVFAYTLVVSAILLTVFGAMWGKRLYVFSTVSLLVWSIFATVYLIFLNSGRNYWELLLLGIPCQLIVILCFIVKRNAKKSSK